MKVRSAVSNLFKSKGLMLVLILGNVALGFTIVVQDQIIEGQSKLIHLLYQDAAELATLRLAAIQGKFKKP